MPTITSHVLLCTVLLYLVQHVLALNILAIASLPLKSHYMAFQNLFRELAVRGHYVTVFNNYPEKNAPPNLHFVDVMQQNNFAGYMTAMNFYETFDSTYLHLYNFYRHLVLNPSAAKSDCENFFTNENIKEHFAKGIKYDVIFVEMFASECGLAYAAAMYDAPIIGITSHVMMPPAYSILGIPFDFSADSYYYSNAGPNPSFYRRIEAILMNLTYKVYNKWYLQRIVSNVFNKYIPNNLLDIEHLARDRMKMFFSYQHFSLTGARILAPQLLEIGGMHIGSAKPVPEEIEKFLSSAKDSAIYVSFGSNLKANSMSPEKLQEFLKAFKKVPQKIIWKYENASLPAGNDNVYTNSWLPQLDILCHPKVVGFVSHGGMLSLSEAAHCGKPAVVVPFFGDQFSNAACAESVGLGHTLYFDRLNADSLANGIKEITSKRMQENAKNVSKMWHDRPWSALESAIFWSEYVARHDSAPPSLPSKNTTWYEALLLDVAAVVLGLLLAVVLLLRLLFKLIKLIFIRSPAKNVEKKSVPKKKSKKA